MSCVKAVRFGGVMACVIRGAIHQGGVDEITPEPDEGPDGCPREECCQGFEGEEGDFSGEI